PVKPVLTCTDEGSEIAFFDTRPCATARRHRIGGLDAAVYRSCDPGADLRTIRARIEAAGGAADGATDGAAGSLAAGRVPAEEEIAASLVRLGERKLVLALGDRWISLALRGEVPPICGVEDFPGGQVELPAPFTEASLDRLAERV